MRCICFPNFYNDFYLCYAISSPSAVESSRSWADGVKNKRSSHAGQSRSRQSANDDLMRHTYLGDLQRREEARSRSLSRQTSQYKTGTASRSTSRQSVALSVDGEPLQALLVQLDGAVDVASAYDSRHSSVSVNVENSNCTNNISSYSSADMSKLPKQRSLNDSKGEPLIPRPVPTASFPTGRYDPRFGSLSAISDSCLTLSPLTYGVMGERRTPHRKDRQPGATDDVDDVSPALADRASGIVAIAEQTGVPPLSSDDMFNSSSKLKVGSRESLNLTLSNNDASLKDSRDAGSLNTYISLALHQRPQSIRRTANSDPNVSYRNADQTLRPTAQTPSSAESSASLHMHASSNAVDDTAASLNISNVPYNHEQGGIHQHQQQQQQQITQPSSARLSMALNSRPASASTSILNSSVNGTVYNTALQYCYA